MTYIRNNIAILLILITVSCDTSKFSETPMTQFAGVWEIHNRGILNGIQIEVNLSDNNYVGRVVKLNNENVVNLFLNVGDVWLLNVKRNSNFEFEITENRLATDLFSTYNIETTEKYIAQFKTKDTIYLGKNGLDGMYVKVQ